MAGGPVRLLCLKLSAYGQELANPGGDRRSRAGASWIREGEIDGRDLREMRPAAGGRRHILRELWSADGSIRHASHQHATTCPGTRTGLSLAELPKQAGFGRCGGRAADTERALPRSPTGI